MKKYLFIIAAACVALVACNKNETPVETPSGASPIKITLTAAIGSDTKVSYTDEDNALKTEWELHDKVSLLAVDNLNNLISNDIFTAQSAGKTVDFAGEFTNDPAVAAVYVYYPALAQGNGSNEAPYSVFAPDSYNDYGVLYDVKIGKPYISFHTDYQLQNTNASTLHLEQYAVMSGKADLEALSEDRMSVTLEHRSYVVKATLKLPQAGLKVYSATMDFNLQSPAVGIGGTGWTHIYETGLFPGNAQRNSLNMLFGEDINSGNGTGITLESDELVVYYPAYAASFWSSDASSYLWNTINVGDKVSLTVKAQEGTYVLDDFEFTKKTVLENGKMYRLSAELVELVAE